MLKIYTAKDQKFLDQFISNTMSAWGGKRDGASNWCFIQPDIGRVTFPAQFVVVQEPRFAVATIQFLH